MKRQAIDWQKICVKHIFGKELAYKIYKQLLKLNSKKELNLKRGKLPKETFHQRRHASGKYASEKVLHITDYERTTS